MAQDAYAQQAPTGDAQNVELETINVEGQGEGGSGAEGAGSPNTLRATTGVARLPGSVQDTPQAITVINQETLKQKNVTTLEEALRNVPGITVSTGEGNGGLNGDQFRIRGFDAKGDIYTDGLRDFGVYVRDSFDIESVQVFKGPSGESFGAGSVGGLINTQSKAARTEDFTIIGGSIGSGPFGRSTADINRKIDETTAVRLNLMGQMKDMVDRDHVEADRFGVAAAVGFGIGTDTEWHLNYVFQHNEGVPDYGVPFVLRRGDSVAHPVTEEGVRRDLFYGKTIDEDVTDAHTLTSRLRHEATDWLTLSNDTRFGYYTRRFFSTAPECQTGATLTPNACSTNFFDNNPATIPRLAGPYLGYEQESWGAQNVTTAQAKFDTGFLRHEFVAGVDVFYQENERRSFTTTPINGAPASNARPLLDPIYGIGDFTITPSTAAAGVRNSDATSVGLFASDRVWLTDEFSVVGGIRWDNLDSNYTTSGANGAADTSYNSETDYTSPKASIIWEPTKQQTYYASYAKSFTPAGLFVTNSTNTIGTTPGQDTLEPEENELYELGAKWGLLGGKLGLTASVFQIDKSNAFYTEPDGDVIPSGEEQRVRGVELGVTGHVTDEWVVQAGYTYLDSEVTDSTTASVIGNEVNGAPRNSFSIFSTYDIASLVNVPGALLVGGGVTYRDEVFTASNNIYEVPETFSLDALISYETDRYRVALNGYNLTDELNYDQFFSVRALPSAGRSVTASFEYKF
jgi:catecholate siderophore receptor